MTSKTLNAMNQPFNNIEILESISLVQNCLSGDSRSELPSSTDLDVVNQCMQFILASSQTSRGRAFILEGSGMPFIWSLWKILITYSEDIALFKKLVEILRCMCEDSEAAEAWGRIGGHRLLQELMDHEDEDLVDSVCKVVSLTMNAGIPFPMKTLEEEKCPTDKTLMKYLLRVSACGNERPFEILFRSIKSRQESMFTVGYKLWSAAIILSNWIIKNRVAFEGKTVLELGAGLGLCGLVASCFAREVVITDFNPAVVENIQKNIELNLMAGYNNNDESLAINNPERLKAGFLDWNIFAEGDIDGLDGGLQDKKFDIVIASDMVYQQADAKGVAMATKHFLSSAGSAFFTLPHPKNRYGVQYLGAELEVHHLSQSSYEVLDPDLLENVEEINLGFQWNNYMVKHADPFQSKENCSLVNEKQI